MSWPTDPKRRALAIKRMSAAHRGKRFSPETIEKLRISHQGLKYGPCSAETRAKISAAKKGWNPSQQTRKRMSAASQGRKLTIAQKAKLSEAHLNISPYGRLGKQYPIHFSHFRKLQYRAATGYCPTNLPRNAKGLQRFIDVVGPVPVEIPKGKWQLSVGRKNHKLGYVAKNYAWQSHAENTSEASKRNWADPIIRNRINRNRQKAYEQRKQK